MGQQSDYKKIYLQESEELLQQMNASLLVLEKDKTNHEALNAIFRCAHTIKSMAASMGYDSVSELAHKLEDVLGEVRSGHQGVSEEIVEALFESFDFLDRMTRSIQKNVAIEAIPKKTLIKLSQFLVVHEELEEEQVKENLTLNHYDKKTLAKAKKEGFQASHVIITLEKGCVLKSTRAFMVFRSLHSIGEVIKSIPELKVIEQESFDRQFACIFVTKKNEGFIRKRIFEILEIEDVNIEPMEVDENWDEEEVVSIDHIETNQKEREFRVIQSVRVDVGQLDKMMNLVEELAIIKLRILDIAQKDKNNKLEAVSESLNRIVDDLQNEVMNARLVPVAQIFNRFPRMVRDLAKKQQKRIAFELKGAEVELDRTILDRVGEGIVHLLKNAIDHGIEEPKKRIALNKREEARLVLSARREKSHVFIEVIDDGAGMDVEEIKKQAIKKQIVTEDELNAMGKEEICILTAHPGFSTKKEVNDISGRGVGLDVVQEAVKALGGHVFIKSELHKGTSVILRLPISTAVIQALLVTSLNQVFAMPVSSITEIMVVNESKIKRVEGNETVLHRNTVLPLIRLVHVFSGVAKAIKEKESFSEESKLEDLNIVVVEFGEKRFGVVVDELLTQQDIVVKQLTKELKNLKGFSGATILGDGSVALVIDVAMLL